MKSVNWARSPSARSTISVARRVSIGMGMRDRCFLRGRVFALLGYEIVEGKRDDGRIHELRRVNYSPQMYADKRGS